MRCLKFLLLAVVIQWSGSVSTRSAEATLARYHFAGIAAVLRDTNSPTLARVGSLPETRVYREALLSRFVALSGLLGRGQTPATNDLRLALPLLEDFVTAESVGEWRQGANAAVDFALAVRLEGQQAQRWQTNLLQLSHASGSSGSPPTAKGDGWQVAWTKTPWNLHIQKSGSWIIVGSGTNSAVVRDLLSELQRNPSPRALQSNNWFEADIDWPRLQRRFPGNPFKPARTQIALNSRGDYVRTLIRAVYPQPIPWKAQAWIIPTNLIRDPLTSFTAMQNVAAFLNLSEKQTRVLGFNPLTNQVYGWSLALAPFETFFVVPMSNASNVLNRLTGSLPAEINPDLKRLQAGNVEWDAKSHAVIWKGLPLVVPHLRVESDGGRDYLLAGLFPRISTTNPPPAELLSQVNGRRDLLYYQWEFTQPRISQLRMLSKMPPISTSTNRSMAAPPPTANELFAKEKWLTAVAPLLGNSITEITVKSPTELNAVRRSPIGLTALELIAFSEWMVGSPPGAGPGVPAARPAVGVPVAKP